MHAVCLPVRALFDTGKLLTLHFQHSVVYTGEGESVVLRGSIDTNAIIDPENLPELQFKSFNSVALGNYHNAVRMSDGRFSPEEAIWTVHLIWIWRSSRFWQEVPFTSRRMEGISIENYLNAARAGYKIGRFRARACHSFH